MQSAAAFTVLIGIWSTTALAINWSVDGVPFILAVTLRMTLAALVCCAALALTRTPWPRDRATCGVYLVAGAGIYSSMLCTYASAVHIPSGLVAVLFGLSPLAASLLGHALGVEKLTRWKVAGTGIALLGLAVIFARSLQLGPNAAWGVGLSVLGVVLQAASAVGLKRINHPMPALAITTGAMLVIVPLYWLTVWLSGTSWPVQIPSRAWHATAYLAVAGSLIGFSLYFYLLKRIDAGVVALIALITPITALWLGQWLNQERVGLLVWLGSAVVVCGLAVHQWPAIRRITPKLLGGWRPWAAS